MDDPRAVYCDYHPSYALCLAFTRHHLSIAERHNLLDSQIFEYIFAPDIQFVICPEGAEPDSEGPRKKIIVRCKDGAVKVGYAQILNKMLRPWPNQPIQ